MARYIKQKSRSYRYDTYWRLRGRQINAYAWRIRRTAHDEVFDHVTRAFRPDADPIFNEVAHEAAMNGIKCQFTGCQGVCFLQPTTHPKGYYSLLKLIAESGTLWRQDLIKAWTKFPMNTVARLIDGKLIEVIKDKGYPNGKLKNHEYSRYVATGLGKAYLKAAERYLVKRTY